MKATQYIRKILEFGNKDAHALIDSCEPFKSVRGKAADNIGQSLLLTAAAYGVVSLSAPQIGYQASMFVLNKSMNTWRTPPEQFKTNEALLKYATEESKNYELFMNPKFELVTTVYIL
jgi:peptide deformylase